MDSELREDIDGLLDRIVQLKDSLDFGGKKERVAAIDELMAAPNFWDNQEKAQGLIAEMQRINAVVRPMEELLQGADDIGVLLEFDADDDSGELEGEIRTATETLRTQLDAAELQASMKNPEDAGNAYLQIQAGEGGTDSADFAEMLMRMYIRWCDNRGFQLEEIDRSDGEEAGIRNVTLLVKGDYAFGFLKGETGNHRLIRISPFDSAGRRHTAFAAVDVTPDMGDAADIEIDWENDVREDVYRAGGAGGQHVNKTSSAVRLTHLPTGVVAACQNERSQHQNRALAQKMLVAKMYQMEQDRRAQATAARRGEKSKIGFGGQTIRHYVLQPQQFVKDDRTDLKQSNPLEVLAGELDPFIDAYLRWSIAK
ncbi:MAG: peptide chain release factor 2 [Planctomycetaceae bacterium]|nr:peptide chain release factor 2 [Planctomycetaceae bacterium]MCA9031487.1 peptide chain release factor 2 [Planctomycetaceae bacterium]MCB9950462.1 peptide chain release factor 2 [Planctomycetaceae bacterium]